MFFRDSVDPYEGMSQYLLIVPWRLSSVLNVILSLSKNLFV